MLWVSTDIKKVPHFLDCSSVGGDDIIRGMIFIHAMTPYVRPVEEEHSTIGTHPLSDAIICFLCAQ